MWFCDLEKAVKALRAIHPTYVIEQIYPAGSAIAFKTSHFTTVYWKKNGEICEVNR